VRPATAFDLRPVAADEPAEHPLRGARRLDPLGSEAVEAPDVQRPVRVARGINAVLVAVCLLGCLQVAGLIAVEVRRLAYTESEVARLEAELEVLGRETADLHAVAERGNDEGYRELLARRQGYVFREETRFVGPRP